MSEIARSDPGLPWERRENRPAPEPRPLERFANEILTRCRGEGPANCVARCPLHVDAHGYVMLTAEGRYREALQRIRERLPFPGILGYLCDHPCELHCKRLDRDAAVRVRDIKRFLAEWEPGEPQHRIDREPERTERVAVVGAGPAGLLAAHDLCLKGYRVTLIDRRPRIGGCLVHRIPEWRVPRRVVQRDLSILDRLPIEIRTRTRLGTDLRLAELRRTHDTVLVLLGYDGALAHLRGADDGFRRTTRGTLWADPVTCETGVPGVFAAGESVSGPATIIQALAHGRRAAESADRCLRGADLAADREAPGPAPLLWTLYIDETLRKRRERTPVMLEPHGPAMSEQEAREEAARCLDCRCRVCVKDCEFLSSHCDSPKELARRVLERSDDDATLRMIYSCNLCSLCATVCPADLDIGAMLAEARREAVRRGAAPLPQHREALRQQAVASWRPFTLAMPEPGRGRSRRVFFPGCALAETAPRGTLELYDVLRRHYPGTGVLLHCCGAVAERLGIEDASRARRERIRELVEQSGAEEVVTACPDCTRTLEGRLGSIRVVSAWELLADVWTGPGVGGFDRVTVHEPCPSRAAQATHAAVRRLIERTGARIDESAYTGELARCCGLGGMVEYVDPDLARRVARRTTDESPAPLVTYCTNCAIALSLPGRPAHHLVDLMFPARARRPGKAGGPRRVVRLLNRIRLRRGFRRLKPLGGE